MGKIAKILGILFSVITVALAVSYFFFKDFSQNEVLFSWLMLAMCGSLICNGTASYINKKDKLGVVSIVSGLIIVIYIVATYPF
ncbi:hypothetical protein D3C73_512390 [compost metagenome]